MRRLEIELGHGRLVAHDTGRAYALYLNSFPMVDKCSLLIARGTAAFHRQRPTLPTPGPPEDEDFGMRNIREL